MPTGTPFKARVRSDFVRLVNIEQGKILLGDYTIDSCMIAAVVNIRLRAALSWHGWCTWVFPMIIITWY